MQSQGEIKKSGLMVTDTDIDKVRIKSGFFDPPFEMDFQQLRQFFKSENEHADKSYEVIEEKEVNKLTIDFFNRFRFQFLLENNRITHFHIPYALSLVSECLEGDYTRFPALKCQKDRFIQLLKNKVIIDMEFEREDQVGFKSLLSKPEMMNDRFQVLPKLKSFQIAESSDFEDVIFVPEHAYGVFKVDGDAVVKAGTADIYSCIGIVAVNRKDSLFGITHLDCHTVREYESSLHNMFELLNARNEAVEVYINANLKGGDHPVVLKWRGGNLTKTLTFSFLAFLSNYPKVKIAGAYLDEECMNHFIIKMSKNVFDILRISSDREEDIKKINYKKLYCGQPIDYRPLVRVASECHSPIVPQPPLVIRTEYRP